jgi:adenylate cyclase
MDGAADDLGSMHNVPSQTRSGTFSFKDKIVIIGDAVKDVHRTPVGNIVYGPEVLATVMDMLMHDRDFIRPMPGWAAILLTLGLCLGVGYSVISLPRIAMGFIVGIAIILLYWVYNFVIFSENAWWLPLVGPTIALLLTLMTATLYRYYVHDFEKRQLTQIFASYVSPQVLEKILTSPAEGLDNLRGVKKELTVLFADLKGFTRQFEHEEPEIMVRQLNEYFNVMIRIILKHNGTYDKFMGDAIMAFFGSPVDLPNHAEKACEASLEMQHALVDLNRKWVAEGMKELKVGIGLSTGPMIVGNFGSDDLKNFTVMGVSVNLGSRLENYTRHVDADVVISEATAQQIAHRAILRDLGKITVHGFTEPVQAFALDDLR